MHRARFAAAALLGVILAIPGSSRGEEARIKRWPQDIPCDAIKKNEDGSYSQIKDLLFGEGRMSGNTFLSDSNEARFWDRKCAQAHPAGPPNKKS
jgi:hypothetical protein